jgi:hypothetical protein
MKTALQAIEDHKSIDEIEQIMLTLPQVDCPVIHNFGEGIYIRELHMAAGTIAIGHLQRFNHFNVFLHGKVMMLNPDGTKTVLEAPLTFFADPGRKVGYVIEPLVWQNIYPNPDNETDIEKLEERWLIKSDSWKQHHELIKGIKTLECEVDRQDFHDALIEIGVSEEIVKEQSENDADQVTFVNNRVMTADSPIHGKGLFATCPIQANEIIIPARINGSRTQAGRYTNHSANPNARMKKDDEGNIYLVSVRNIHGCKGGELGEEITVDYRQAYKENLRIGGTPCLE